MLQSEFFERTGVNLTGEEYAKVEAIYNILPNMDKDEFCMEWKKLKDNLLIKEITKAARNLETEKLEAEQTIRDSKAKIAAMTEAHQKDIEKIGENYKKHMEEFGRKRVTHMDDYTYIYDDINEEFGMDFICRVKLEENIELEKEEREHLIKKL